MSWGSQIDRADEDELRLRKAFEDSIDLGVYSTAPCIRTPPERQQIIGKAAPLNVLTDLTYIVEQLLAALSDARDIQRKRNTNFVGIERLDEPFQGAAGWMPIEER